MESSIGLQAETQFAFGALHQLSTPLLERLDAPPGPQQTALQQAVALSPEPAPRASRALAAAQAKHEAGASETALELLTIAATGPLDALQAARLELLRAQIAFHLTRGIEVPRMLLDAATMLPPLDAAPARETYLHALDAAIITGGRPWPRRAGGSRGRPRGTAPA